MSIGLDAILPIVSRAIGRDLSIEVGLFYRARAAVGHSLTQEGQEFFIKNWPEVVTFMESPEGQKALSQFLNSWADSFKPKSLLKEQSAEPAQSSGIILAPR